MEWPTNYVFSHFRMQAPKTLAAILAAVRDALRGGTARLA
jgi:hypothetical protein